MQGRWWWGCACILLLSLMGCATTTTGSTASPTHRSTASRCAPWGMGYLTKEGHVQVVTCAGTQDHTGPLLPGFDQSGVDLGQGTSVSPDGHTLVYGAPSLTIIDLEHAMPPRQYPTIAPVATSFWSPGGQQVAVTDNGWRFWIATVAGGDPITIPGGPFTQRSILHGWLDATHLAVSGYDATNGIASWQLEALTIATGQVRPIVTLHPSGLGDIRAILSTDGQQALVVNTPFEDTPFTPFVAVIQVETGTVTLLPQIANSTAAGVTALVWRPNTATVAATTGFVVDHTLHWWMLDLGHDTATPGDVDAYPVGWTPDGQQVVVSTRLDAIVGAGPYTLSLWRVATNTLTLFTQQAYSMPLLGFLPLTTP